MFLKVPFHGYPNNLQQTQFILNTVLLILALIIVELVFSEMPISKKKYLRYFYPLIVVMVGIMVYAAVKQVGKS